MDGRDGSRLGEEVVHSRHFARRLLICVGRVRDDEGIPVNRPLVLVLLDLATCLDSIHDGHLEVHDYDLVARAALLVGPALDHLDGFLAVHRLVAADTELAHEYLAEYVPVHVDVVDNEDLGAVAHTRNVGEIFLLDAHGEAVEAAELGVGLGRRVIR